MILLQADFIAVDAGNTRIKIGCYQSGALKSVFYWNLNEPLPSIFAPKAAIGSVADHEMDVLQQLKPLANQWMIFNENTLLPFQSVYAWNQLGNDRKLAIFSAKNSFPNQSFLLASLGTCLTIDWVDSAGVHQGGSISPGWNMRLQSMHHYTQRLPQIKAETTIFPANNTQNAMQAGAQDGMLSEILFQFQKIQQKEVNTRLLLSGGDAPIFVPLMNDIAQEFPNAVLDGLFFYHQL